MVTTAQDLLVRGIQCLEEDFDQIGAIIIVEVLLPEICLVSGSNSPDHQS